MKTHGLTIKIRAKKPKNVSNCESSANGEDFERNINPWFGYDCHCGLQKAALRDMRYSITMMAPSVLALAVWILNGRRNRRLGAEW